VERRWKGFGRVENWFVKMRIIRSLAMC